ncbi:Tyrosine-sulfated glycopeptide receptor 1 [Morella rubra]|uniref:Tyrosine-sulfated glycopeptide receptor 1 n=1 Tax=Morella rubra TaxID=262757 RepID=A0A6A1WNL3_9ROSI|nr:Tyrosine-sulfated glycopeptide receptor 1 [Morella rubra]
MDRNSLLSLPFYANSPPLNWSSTDCCNWEGIACDPRGYVNHISLPSKGLIGNIFPFLENLTHLSYLNLSHNLLSSTLSTRLFSSLNQLIVLDLSSNYLAGDLSFQFSSEGLHASIQVLDISSNYFNGTIKSSFLQRAWNLTKLNLSNNTGSLPQSLMNCTNLVELNLWSNLFEGNITTLNFSCLHQLTVLDMGQNDFTALISAQALENDTTFTYGRGEYNSLLSIYPGISLKNNSLGGKIPIEIGRLKLLGILDLSDNNFSGNIPSQISDLTNLEKLDLFANRLSGEIPVSLASLNFLASFSIANNNLYGSIPSGTQLQSFGPSAYEGSAGLCGVPLPKECTHTVNSNEDKETQNQKIGEHRIPSFPIIVLLGFITGFWGVCGSLVLNRNWRIAYFRFLENLGDWLYVTMAVSWARLLRRLL